MTIGNVASLVGELVNNELGDIRVATDYKSGTIYFYWNIEPGADVLATLEYSKKETEIESADPKEIALQVITSIQKAVEAYEKKPKKKSRRRRFKLR